MCSRGEAALEGLDRLCGDCGIIQGIPFPDCSKEEAVVKDLGAWRIYIFGFHHFEALAVVTSHLFHYVLCYKIGVSFRYYLPLSSDLLDEFVRRYPWELIICNFIEEAKSMVSASFVQRCELQPSKHVSHAARMARPVILAYKSGSTSLDLLKSVNVLLFMGVPYYIGILHNGANKGDIRSLSAVLWAEAQVSS